MKTPLKRLFLLLFLFSLGCESEELFSVFPDTDTDFKVELLGDLNYSIEGYADNESIEYTTILSYQDVKEYNFNGFVEPISSRYSLQFFITEDPNNEPTRVDIQFSSQKTGLQTGEFEIIDAETTSEDADYDGFVALVFYNPDEGTPSFYRSLRGTLRIKDLTDGNKEVMFEMRLNPIFGAENWLDAKGKMLMVAN